MSSPRDPWEDTLAALDKQDAAFAKLDKSLGGLKVAFYIIAAGTALSLVGAVLTLVTRHLK